MARRASKRFVVVWWAYQKPFFAVLSDEDEADIAANLRNGLVIEVHGKDLEVIRISDHWRRNEAGAPLPAELRGLPK